MKIFERKSIRIGNLGVIVSFCSLLAACIAAYVVFQQFKEMSAQTELLNRAARQARIDSAATDIATGKQLKIAQQSLDAIQGQLKEARRNADYARQSITNAQKALDASIVMSEKQDALITKQIEAVQNQTELAERPWIEVSDPNEVGDQSFVVNKNGDVSASIQLTIKNIGMTAARGTIVTIQFLGRGDSLQASRIIQKLCNQSWPPSESYEFGALLFPNDVLHPGGYYPVGPKGMNSTPNDPNVFLLPERIVGCVQYKSSDTTKLYYTGFSYSVYLMSSNGPIISVRFDPVTGRAMTFPESDISGSDEIKIPAASVRFYSDDFNGGIVK